MTRRPRSPSSETTKLILTVVGGGVTAPLRGSLVVLQGPEADIGAHRWLDQPVTLGRDPLVELPLDDLRISRRHCQVLSEGEVYFIQDLHSTNGTRLNDEPIKPGKRVQLRANDCVFLGSCVVKFAVVSDLEVAYHARMDALVGTDDLTGLVVKRRFDAALGRAVETALLEGEPLAVMMLDMDGLKEINDTHGHPVGAYSISAVGKIIGEVISPHGDACRLGGDEFAAFLRAQTKEVGVALAESIRRRVREHRFEKDGVVVRPTISIGVAGLPVDGESAEALLKRADEALYRAKRAGKNRVAT